MIGFIQSLQERKAPISLKYIGTSTKGRPMPLVIVSWPPVSGPSEARRSNKLVIYIQANIHAGEVEGKEAAQMLLRRLSQEAPRGLLQKAIFLVNPIYNIDGNEAFGPQERNRPEQDGPPLVGERANGQGLDLNRDAIKAESPEMRSALEEIYTRWDPDLVMDLHTTDGTRHGYELTYSPPLNPNTEPEIMRFSRDELLPNVRKQLKKEFGMELFDYGNAEKGKNGKEWFTFGHEGRYVTNYVGLRNRIGILSEATTYISFHDRVVATERFVWAVVSYASQHAKRVHSMIAEADQRVIGWGQNPATAPSLGVAFRLKKRGSESVLLEKLALGAKAPFGRPKSIESTTMPINDRFETTATAKLPLAYLIPREQAVAADLLVAHGIVVEKLSKPWQGSAQRFMISKVQQDERPFQGHRLIKLQGKLETLSVRARVGDYLVRTAQPLGILVFHMLEPESTDGLCAWGFLGEGFTEGTMFPILKCPALDGAVTERIGRIDLRPTSRFGSGNG